MKIEVGNVYALSESPKIVGVVTGVKDAKGDSWYIQTTLGDRLIWNNKSQTWRGETDFDKLTESNLLVSNTNTGCCGECECCESEIPAIELDSDTQPIDINVGEKWISTNGETVLIVSVNEHPEGDGMVYTGVVYTDDGVDIGIFDRYGKDLLDQHELDYLEDTLFQSWEL